MGEDPIVGGPHSFVFSSDLLHHIQCRGILSLYHVAMAPARGSNLQGWMSTSQLGVVGAMDVEWSHYVRKL